MDLKNLNFNDIPSWPRPVKLAAIAIVGFVLLLISILAVIWPQYSSLSTARNQELDLKQELILLIPQMGEQQQNAQQIQQLKKLIDKHHQFLPKSEQMEDILDTLNQLAANNQLDLLLLKPQPLQQDEIYARIPIDINATGDYVQIANFLNQLAHLNYYLYISKMNLTQVSQKTSINQTKKDNDALENNLSMEMTAELYYYAPKPKENKQVPTEVAHEAKK